MNGDGLPDRLMRTVNGPYDKLKVQFNTGAGFGPVLDWGTLLGGDGSSTWNSISSVWADSSDTSHTFVALADLNGDGLPDRILRKWNAPFDSWIVQFNNGVGFDYPETWGPVNGQGFEAYSASWGAPEGTYQGAKFAILQDINGDGLDDVVRYLRQQDDVVVPQAPGEFLLNGRFRMNATELVGRANRMRSRQGKPPFPFNGRASRLPEPIRSTGHPMFRNGSGTAAASELS